MYTQKILPACFQFLFDIIELSIKMFIRAVFKMDINDSVTAFKINDVFYGYFLNFLVECKLIEYFRLVYAFTGFFKIAGELDMV